MATRYVDGTNGNDAWDGLAPNFVAGINGPKRTLNGAEDTPAVAGDKIWVRSGVYRELLTCDVSGGVGAPIVYEGDVLGQIWSPGGVVRITGSNNDQTVVRAFCIASDAKNYRTFRGFLLDSVTTTNISTTNGCQNWIVEDCCFFDFASNAISVAGANQLAWMVRRCFIQSGIGNAIAFTNAVAVDNTGHLIQNCTILATAGADILSSRIGGISIRNCYLTGSSYGVRINAALTVGQTITINNCNLFGLVNGVVAVALGEILENFNNFYSNTTNRTNVAAGANSTAYPPVFQPPILNSGASQISGFQLPWAFGALSSWSQIRAIAGASEATEDLFGIARPITAALNSWGPIQFQQDVIDATTFPGMSTIELSTAGRYQYFIPVEAVNTTITVLVQREANYAGVNPQMILKQPGQADITVTDAGGASAWNTLTHTWIPAATPGWVAIELVSNNTAGAGAFAVYFRNLTASPLGQTTQEAWFTDRQPINYVEEAAVATAAFSPVGGTIVGA